LYTRLPPGHTHEDIDAAFGVIWKWFRQKPCATLEDYKNGISEAFKSTKLHADVIDLYIVPNYHGWFESCIDKKLSKLHKEEVTQLQWRFSAVKNSSDFPLGCKTMYRAYSSEKVVELVKKDKLNCDSFIGTTIGLEPVTTLVNWYPAANPLDLRRPNKY